MKYPCRCEIIDVTGGTMAGLPIRTPDASKPFIGQQGLAELTSEGVRITLDSGDVIWGYDCWWRKIKAAMKGESK